MDVRVGRYGLRVSLYGHVIQCWILFDKLLDVRNGGSMSDPMYGVLLNALLAVVWHVVGVPLRYNYNVYLGLLCVVMSLTGGW